MNSGSHPLFNPSPEAIASAGLMYGPAQEVQEQLRRVGGPVSCGCRVISICAGVLGTGAGAD